MMIFSKSRDVDPLAKVLFCHAYRHGRLRTITGAYQYMEATLRKLGRKVPSYASIRDFCLREKSLRQEA